MRINYRPILVCLAVLFIINIKIAHAQPINLDPIPNQFSAGDTISSSEMNENFSTVESNLSTLGTALDELCLQPGQVRVSALVNVNQTIDADTLFSCNGAAVTHIPQMSDFYVIQVAGISDMNTVHAQVTPHNNVNVIGCEVQTSTDPAFMDRLVVQCKNKNGTGIQTSFYLTIINTPVTQ